MVAQASPPAWPAYRPECNAIFIIHGATGKWHEQLLPDYEDKTLLNNGSIFSEFKIYLAFIAITPILHPICEASKFM